MWYIGILRAATLLSIVFICRPNVLYYCSYCTVQGKSTRTTSAVHVRSVRSVVLSIQEVIDVVVCVCVFYLSRRQRENLFVIPDWEREGATGIHTSPLACGWLLRTLFSLLEAAIFLSRTELCSGIINHFIRLIEEVDSHVERKKVLELCVVRLVDEQRMHARKNIATQTSTSTMLSWYDHFRRSMLFRKLYIVCSQLL